MHYSTLFFVLIFPCAVCFGQERSPLPCTDGLDNDGDRLRDCFDPDCITLANLSCEICNLNGLSFADEVLEYIPGCENIPWNNPAKALGLGDWKSPVDGNALALGEGGAISLAFTNNILLNSGDNDADLWIFEIGDIVEPCSVFLAPFDEFTKNELRSASLESKGAYFAFGGIKGNQTYIDIDEIMPGYARGQLKFNAVHIVDFPDLTCNATLNPGADIDAICALQSATFDCAGELAGRAQLDSCGHCRLPDDPRFNDCRDCAGVLGGLAQIDSCGECLSINDPLFDQCILENPPPTTTYYLPNAFSPNDDGHNDCFGVLTASDSALLIKSFKVYNRWGSLVFKFENGNSQTLNACWDGRIGQQIAPSGLYFYKLQIDDKYQNGLLQLLR